ncbi:unnamed protein product [Sphenostylis stenocarpa]|uniref:Peptidase A1 domain-containing protein n=1 Tax=Sphenostylis stenocarpa TaxID=92480 RepID=A0AA86S4S0_9FABA|nr:unnamed protein product [Sphenostylis stenocarpa]
MVITSKSQSLNFTLSLFGILHFLIFLTPSQATTHRLIHRDSPLSPFYHPTTTPSHRLHNAFQRSLNRINSFKLAVANPNNGNTQAPVKPGGGEYLMTIFIGTPPVQVIGIADTGSDLIWTQCLPCIHCYPQTIPLFNPQHSKSYNTLPCRSTFCNPRYVDHPRCGINSTCWYRYSYFDGSHTAGNLASETFTLGTTNPISLPNTLFGCAHDTTGIFDKSGSGIIGLGRGRFSLISQLNGSKMFSYCLTPNTLNSTSKLSFGEDSVVSGPEVVTTPFVTTGTSTSYHITVEALSVGKTRIPFVNKSGIEGNVIIDSGTTYTFLPLGVYNGLVSALNNIIRAKKGRDPNGILTLCYQTTADKIRLPIITAHFKGGDVKLQPVNTFSWVRKDVVCLTMIHNDNTVFGNMAQTNFLVGFDLEASTVSFKPTDCSLQ